MILVFDGVDKTGKDTLISEVHKATNYKHIIINRFLASNFVYGKFKNRMLDFDEYLKYDKELSKLKFVKQIILVASEEDLKKRFLKHKEKDIKLEEISTVLKLYEKYMKITKIDTLVVDTSKWDEKECLTKILNFIEDEETDL